MASIQKRPDGKFRARYRDEAGKEHSKHFSRKTDAQRWLDEVTASVVTGLYVDPRAGRVTFTRYYAAWSQRQVWAPGTVLAMNLAARGVTFGEVPMTSLRRSHVEQWVKQMVTVGLAPGTIQTRFNNVRSVLRAAVRDRVIAVDPAEGVTLPRGRRRDVAMEIPTTEQVASLMGMAESQFTAFIALAAFAGLRLGEAAAIQLGDVDFLRRTIDVRRQVQNGTDLSPPKYGSERTIYASDELLSLLAQHVAMQPPTGVEGWLFHGPQGRPLHQNSVGYLWRKACGRAGVHGFTLHDCRHYFASGLIADGCDVVTVQRALGHSKPSITLDTYTHLWPTAEDRTRAASGSLLSDALRILADSVRTDAAQTQR